jgi:hypothetical protein
MTARRRDSVVGPGQRSWRNANPLCTNPNSKCTKCTNPNSIGEIQEPSARRLWPAMDLPYESLQKQYAKVPKSLESGQKSRYRLLSAPILTNFCIKLAFVCTYNFKRNSRGIAPGWRNRGSGRNIGEIRRNPNWRNQLGCATVTISGPGVGRMQSSGFEHSRGKPAGTELRGRLT